MNIAYSGFNDLLTLQEGEGYKICLEDVFVFRNFIEKLLLDINVGTENFILSEKDKSLKLNKISDVIINPFELDINQRKLLLKLYSEMQDMSVNETMFHKTLELKRIINNYMIDLEICSEYALQHDLDFEIKDIFNAVKLKIDDDAVNLVDKVASYLRNAHKFLGIRVFWFVGLNTYLKPEELKLLFKEASYNKINIIMLENQLSDKVYGEKLYVLDKDACVIHCDY